MVGMSHDEMGTHLVRNFAMHDRHPTAKAATMVLAERTRQTDPMDIDEMPWPTQEKHDGE